MSLFLGPRRNGLSSVVQDALLWASFVMQDFVAWLQDHGRLFEDWICPSGRQPAKERAEEFRRLP
ncbi:MAG: hypothetical protein WC876_03750 [Candidatus Thermoplasmatota archaeon]|jgi:hypothetical protein